MKLCRLKRKYDGMRSDTAQSANVAQIANGAAAAAETKRGHVRKRIRINHVIGLSSHDYILIKNVNRKNIEVNVAQSSFECPLTSS